VANFLRPLILLGIQLDDPVSNRYRPIGISPRFLHQACTPLSMMLN
jgi:hypothetical protein